MEDVVGTRAPGVGVQGVEDARAAVSAARSGSQAARPLMPTGDASRASRTTTSSRRCASARARMSSTRSPLGSMTTAPRPAAMSWRARLAMTVDLPVPVGPMRCRCRSESSVERATGRDESVVATPRIRPRSSNVRCGGSNFGCAAGTPGSGGAFGSAIGQAVSGTRSETLSWFGQTRGERASEKAASEARVTRTWTPGNSSARTPLTTPSMRLRDRAGSRVEQRP